MKLKTVVMFAPCNVLPVRQGSDRFIVQIAEYLHAQPNIYLRLVIQDKNNGFDYSGICNEVAYIDLPKRWHLWDILNKIIIRTGIATLNACFLSLGMRERFSPLIGDADYIILNYLQWFSLIPSRIRKTKTLCVTHDLLHYRVASFTGTDRWWKKVLVCINKIVELRLLKGFRKIGILADYEEEILRSADFPMSMVMKTGMPISVSAPITSIRASNKKYDFVFLGGGAVQNIEGLKYFFDRVMPHMPQGEYSMAVAGQVCQSPLFKSIAVPKSIKLHVMGYVDSPTEFCMSGVVGLGTLPFGSGIKVKVVEMMMSGLPMLVTDHGIEGIPTGAAVVNIDEVGVEIACCRVYEWLNNVKGSIALGIKQAEMLRKEFSPEERLSGLLSDIEV